MQKSSTTSEEPRPLWGRGLLSPIYSFFHPVSPQEIQRVIDESRAERAKADATMARADATMAKADATMAKADATMIKADRTMARSDESNKKTERVIANARAFLSQVEDYKQRLEQGENVSPPVPRASL